MAERGSCPVCGEDYVERVLPASQTETEGKTYICNGQMFTYIHQPVRFAGEI